MPIRGGYVKIRAMAISTKMAAAGVTRGDIVVILLAALLVAGLHSGQWRDGGPADRVRIVTGEAEFAVLSLAADRVVDVPGPLGTTVVEIRDGAARCAASPGAQGICQRAGWLRHGGDIAVSLPNRVLIEVLGGAPRYDSINF